MYLSICFCLVCGLLSEHHYKFNGIEIDLSSIFLLENVGGERLSAQRSCFVLVLNTSQSKKYEISMERTNWLKTGHPLAQWLVPGLWWYQQ